MTFFSILNAAALVAALYICGASVCRLRHKRQSMKPVWVVIYFLVFALSSWLAADVIVGGVDARSALTSIAAAIYLRVTAVAWRDGVPSIAKKEVNSGDCRRSDPLAGGVR